MSEHTPRTLRPRVRARGRTRTGSGRPDSALTVARRDAMPARLRPLLTVDAARRVGWLVYQTSDGAWGRPASRHDLWACKPASWPSNVQPALLHATRDDALTEVEERLAYQFGMTRAALHEVVLNGLSPRYRALIEERRR